MPILKLSSPFEGSIVIYVSLVSARRNAVPLVPGKYSFKEGYGIRTTGVAAVSIMAKPSDSDLYSAYDFTIGNPGSERTRVQTWLNSASFGNADFEIIP